MCQVAGTSPGSASRNACESRLLGSGLSCPGCLVPTTVPCEWRVSMVPGLGGGMIAGSLVSGKFPSVVRGTELSRERSKRSQEASVTGTGYS